MGGRGRGRGGGPLGGRRPLRFLAWKLGLSEEQFRSIAAILSALKTARAEAHVARRKAAADYADAVASEVIDAEKVASAAAHQARADAAIRDAIGRAIADIHALLDEGQRAEFSLLLREAPPWML